MKFVSWMLIDSGAKGEAKIALKSSSSLHADLSQKSRVTNQTGEIVEPEKRDGGIRRSSKPRWTWLLPSHTHFD